MFTHFRDKFLFVSALSVVLKRKDALFLPSSSRSDHVARELRRGESRSWEETFNRGMCHESDPYLL